MIHPHPSAPDRPSRRRLLLPWLLTLVATIIAALPAARAQTTPLDADDPPRIDAVEVGIDGHYKVGCWTPFTVKLAGWTPVDAELVTRVTSPDGNQVSTPHLLPPGFFQSDGRVTGFFRPGSLDGPIRFALQQGETRLAERTFAVDRTATPKTEQVAEGMIRPAMTLDTDLWVVLGNSVGFADAADKLNQAGASSANAPPAVRLIELSDNTALPTEALAYDAVNVLIITEQFDLSAAQNDALSRWVADGGRLIVTVGANADQFADSPLAQWIDVTVNGTTTLRELGGFSGIVPGSSPVRVRGRVTAAQVGIDDGRVLASGISGPLLVRVAHGFGTVTFLGLDLDARPFRGWDALPDACLTMASIDFRNRDKMTTSHGGAIAQSGITDLQTQLHSAMDHFDAVEGRSTWAVMGWILLYLALLGPLDYLIVHKLLGRPRWTWATLPLLILVSALLATSVAASRNDVGRLVNQLEIIDIDEREQQVRGRAWMTFYSPTTQRYKIDAEPMTVDWVAGQSDDAQPPDDVTSTIDERVGWVGLAETGMGGMYHSGGIQLGKPDYQMQVDATGVANLPVSTWSTGSLTGWWSHNIEPTEPLVTSELTYRMGRLEGTFTHRLPVPIESWFIAYRGRVYRPEVTPGRPARAIPPGVAWSPVEFDARSRVLRDYLLGVQRRQTETEDGKGGNAIATRNVYDILSRDVSTFARIMTFHDAAGGDNYTTLNNHVLDSLDLSRLLFLKRAVLFGRVNTLGNRYSLNGETIEPTRQDTFVRLVMPVVRVETDATQEFNDFQLELESLKNLESQ